MQVCSRKLLAQIIYNCSGLCTYTTLDVSKHWRYPYADITFLLRVVNFVATASMQLKFISNFEIQQLTSDAIQIVFQGLRNNSSNYLIIMPLISIEGSGQINSTTLSGTFFAIIYFFTKYDASSTTMKVNETQQKTNTVNSFFFQITDRHEWNKSKQVLKVSFH